MTDLDGLLIVGVLTFVFVRIMTIFETRNWPSEKVSTLSGAVRELILRRDA